MATFLDVGLLGHFAGVFAFIFVFAVVYAILTKTQPLGENNGVYALISVALAAITLFFEPAVGIIFLSVPWIVLLLLGAFAIILIMMFLGVSSDTIGETVTNNPSVFWTVAIMLIVIFLYAGSQTIGPALAGDGVVENEGSTSANVSSEGQDLNQEVREILFHPKVLGALFILIIAAFTVKLLAETK